VLHRCSNSTGNASRQLRNGWSFVDALQAATAIGSVALNSKIRDLLLEEGSIQLLEKLSHSKNPAVLAAAQKAKSNFNAMMLLEDLAMFAASAFLKYFCFEVSDLAINSPRKCRENHRNPEAYDVIRERSRC
jgi:hypothetical protein